MGATEKKSKLPSSNNKLGGGDAANRPVMLQELNELVSQLSGNYATQAYVLQQIAELINSSPSTLDTLKELADAINDDAAFYTKVELVANKDTDVSLTANSDTKYASQKAIKAYVDTLIATKQNTLGYTAENSTNKSTDGTLASNSDTLYPSQKAVKTYADQLIAANDAMVFKGATDCSTNPNYPAADRGWTYRVSVAGKIGGASGTVVEVGDIFICNTDGTASGTQAAVGSAWNVIQTNIDGAVVGPASATDSNIGAFDGTTGKLIKDGGIATSAIVTLTSTSTLTNKRITVRGGTTTSSATPTVNTDNVDYYSITALAAAITSFTTNLTGTPNIGDTLWIAITDNGTARAITWGASFESSGNVTLPSTTVVSTRLDIGFIWNDVTSKWRCIGVA